MQAQIQALHLGHINRRQKLDKQSKRLKWREPKERGRGK